MYHIHEICMAVLRAKQILWLFCASFLKLYFQKSKEGGKAHNPQIVFLPEVAVANLVAEQDQRYNKIMGKTFSEELQPVLEAISIAYFVSTMTIHC